LRNHPYHLYLLSAAWKIIKTWLPAGAVKKIKFLTKNNIGEYVAEDQRPPAWAGKFQAVLIILLYRDQVS
jgi:hypothetical protein